ncbi:bifunctional methylenetetrahydrofolate dehydrogenase/methenyltetrahydrofolate cyclohydrolase FolD [candidate division BRC1 bacterium HGW-BRC1-1]|jgi:methylenetetrahydrofolate dehydrogenase (NADP+)/methenyltetrahydrofolate cyclohydrolase|nr:MAG: bifunctional methylenetetrahydrofolate dehydrogenase/methenyltetrahydrofolate cyclohydrolase FolD [candidate division BRC1 bacterium HGW-BRC1-1]
MSAKIIDGKAIAARVRSKVGEDAAAFTARTSVIPGLIVVLVGENPASQVYVRNKRKACLELGWFSEIHSLPATATQREVEAEIDTLNADGRVHGILLQLPLPAHLDEQALLQRIRPEKDVDGFHPVNVGKLSLGLSAPVPCTPLGIHRLLLEEGIETAGKFAVIIGRSNIVGKPVAQLLMRKGPGGDATVCVCHSRSSNLPDIIRRADIVVAAIGSPEFVKGEWIKPGATVIDVGINRIDDPASPRGTRLVGDVEFNVATKIASAITPVPGGVGPMTIAMLMANTLHCAQALTGKTP